MTRFNSYITLACGISCFALFASQSFAASTYNIEVYDGFDPGWSMDGGTITTSGFIGTVDESNIGSVFTDWSVRFTSPTDSYELTPANSEFSFPVQPDNVLVVDAVDIVVPFYAFEYNLALTSTTGQSIRWNGGRLRQEGFGSVFSVFGSVELADGSMGSSDFFGECEFGFPQECPTPALLVAVVPEPNSLLLLAVGIVLWSTMGSPRYGSLRSRRAHQEQPR